MTLVEIIEKCNMLSVYEERCMTDEYYEIVFYNKDINEWTAIFTEILGKSVKPAGDKPTKEQMKMTDSFGGILVSQTLFVYENDDQSIVVMFWPWQDGVHTTVKMALTNK